MKVASLALAMLLLVALWTGTHSDTITVQTSTCCFKENFVAKKIPPKFIRSCRFTGPNCSRQAMIVTLIKGKEVCVDPMQMQLAKCKGK